MVKCAILSAVVAVFSVGAATGADGDNSAQYDKRKKVDPAHHWAFQPLKKPGLPGPSPEVGGEASDHPVDAFVRQELKKRGLKASAPSSREVLARRAAFDLTGLPPKPELLKKFLEDTESGAWDRYLDALLSEKTYGERWGRHWLDVARYADTQGYQAGGRSTLYPYAYTYRDWVISAFNKDMPYDRFVELQVAADRYHEAGETGVENLAALGFITVGNRFINRVPDIIDDRIDVVTRGFLGLTAACSRCHDHKFDPIPTSDYYALYGVFGSSMEPDDLPLIGRAPDPEQEKLFLAEKAKAEAKITDYRKNFYHDSRKPDVVGSYLEMIVRTRPLTSEQRRVEVVKAKLREKLVDAWSESLNRLAYTDNPHPLFRLWSELDKAGDGGFDAAYKEHVAPLVEAPVPVKQKPEQPGTEVAAGENRENPKPAPTPEPAPAAEPAGDKVQGTPLDRMVAEALSRRQVKNMKDVARAYGEIIGRALAGTEDAQGMPEPVRQLVAGEALPTGVEEGGFDRFYHRQDRESVSKLGAEVKKLEAKHPGAPPRAMVMNDSEKPRDFRVFIRGNPRQQGEVAPRKFLSVLGGQPLNSGSGRRQLAEAISDPANPLTARVMVNRVWMHHFGTALVDTPSDFGVQCEEPVHRELLDYLSARFVESGWSIKQLHKLIMTSSTYRQCGDVVEANLEADPENRLFWRMPRRKLGFEAMRDTMLYVSGELDTRMGGRPFEITENGAGALRRTVYAKVDRQDLPPVFAAFDFANPDAHVPARVETMVPQKALYLLNGEFSIARAKALVKLPGIANAASDEERAQFLYRRLFGRAPTGDELETVLAFVKPEPVPEPKAEPAPQSPWEYGYANVPKAGPAPAPPVAAAPVALQFQPLRHHHSGRWQAGMKFPDDKLGYISWGRGNGHPGDGDLAAVMRWTAPEDMVARIAGKLERPAKEGDGVRASIWKNGSEVLFSTEIKPQGSAPTGVQGVELKKGDTLEFVVGAMGGHGWDGFNWSPEVHRLIGEEKPPVVVAHAGRDFFVPPPPPPKSDLTRWEQLAQVMLVSNEFAFVD